MADAAQIGTMALAMDLLAGIACGLLIGIERGWHQRGQRSGTRVAGIRTFTLLGGAGALIAIIALLLNPVIAAVPLAGLVGLLAMLFLGDLKQTGSRDATTMVSAFVALALGLLAGAGHAALAVAGAALTSFVLAMRKQTHGFLDALSQQEVQAIARYAVLACAVLPFLPNAQYGPYDAWNPFKLWLVVLLITGFSIAGYVANRVVGERRGTIATALIGGAYSSTAVTASLATRLRGGEAGPLSTGIALASSVMYVRVMALTAALAPMAAWPLAKLVGPPAIVAFLATAAAWKFDSNEAGAAQGPPRKPFELLPALGFLLAVAGASLLVNWAQASFGATGGGLSLFIAGSFDVDAAIVAFSALPAGVVDADIAALALAGTVAVNMVFKTGIAIANAGWGRGRNAALALMASIALLVPILLWRLWVLVF